MVVPFAAGGAQDTIARGLAKELGALWKQTVVVENKVGAAGVIGSDFVAKAAPDGYTVLFGTEGPIVGAPFSQDKMPYDALRDLVPVGMVASFPLILVAHPSLKATTVTQLVEAAKRSPGTVPYASNGIGGSLHTAMEIFQRQAGISLNHIAYKGGAPAVQDVLAGHVALTFSSVSTVKTHLDAGRLVPLAIASTERYPALPNVPTFREAGVPNFTAGTWGGLLLPRGVAADVTASYREALASALASASFRELLAKGGAESVPGTPEQFAQRIRDDYEKNACVLKGQCGK